MDFLRKIHDIREKDAIFYTIIRNCVILVLIVRKELPKAVQIEFFYYPGVSHRTRQVPDGYAYVQGQREDGRKTKRIVITDI